MTHIRLGLAEEPLGRGRAPGFGGLGLSRQLLSDDMVGQLAVSLVAGTPGGMLKKPFKGPGGIMQSSVGATTEVVDVWAVWAGRAVMPRSATPPGRWLQRDAYGESLSRLRGSSVRSRKGSVLEGVFGCGRSLL